MPKTLEITQFGNPVLRKVTKKLTTEQIKSDEIQQLISEMKATVKSGDFGVGLAAPQIGRSLALSVITLRPTASHPERDILDIVAINPEVIKGLGNEVDKWEGCMSFGSGEPVFATTKRFERVKVKYLDQKGKEHLEELSGLVAHVFQHEVDHLNGILFVDRVFDPKSWMSASEYIKMLASNKNKT